MCEDLKQIRKNRDEEFKCSFDVDKCDIILDNPLKEKVICINHVIRQSKN